MKRITIGLLVLAAACSRHHEGTSLTSVQLDASPPAQGSLADLGRSWDRAMSQRDLSLLGPLFATTVTFYGAPMRRDQVIQVESDAFVKDPSFTQEALGVRTVSPSRVEVSRRWVRFRKKYKGTTWIEGKQENDRWVIASIGDTATDERFAHRGPSASFCDELAQHVALSTPEAQALVSNPPERVDTFVAVGPPQFPAYSIVATTTANGAKTTVGWYEVEPCFLYSPAPNVKGSPATCVPPGGANGAVTDAFTGRVLTATPALLTQMSKCPI